MKNNVKMIVQFDGTNFFGWQKSEGKRTIQGVLESTFEKMFGEDVVMEASGRTDRGVHAAAQVVSFSTSVAFAVEKFAVGFNSFLPNDLSVLSAEIVADNFHARFCAKEKTYRYAFFVSKVKMPLKERFAHRVWVDVDLSKMIECAKFFVGTHDFSSFCKVESLKKNNTRTISNVWIEQKDEFFFINVKGDGFLHNMVRIIAGTILEVGKGKIEPQFVEKIIASKNRCFAKTTLPACGLTLVEVKF